MTRSLLALAATLALCGAVALGDDGAPESSKGAAAKATVDAIGVEVRRQAADKHFTFPTNFVRVTVRVVAPGKQFLFIDNDASSVTDFSDDKGTDLRAAGFGPQKFGKTSFDGFPTISLSRAGLLTTVGSDASKPIAKGASKLTLKGTLVIVCGAGEKSSDAKELAVKLNTEVKFGDYTAKVTQEKGFGDSGPTVLITSKKPFKTAFFKDADGNALEFNNYGNPYRDYNKTWNSTYYLRKQAGKIKVGVISYSKEEKLTVPVNLSVGLGL